VEDLSKHKMEAEYYNVDENACRIVNKAKSEGHRICSVGTTTMRALESTYTADKLLKPSEVLVNWYFGDKKSFVWAINQSGLSSFASINLTKKDIARDVKSLRKSLDPGVSSVDEIPIFDVNTKYTYCLNHDTLVIAETMTKKNKSKIKDFFSKHGLLCDQTVCAAGEMKFNKTSNGSYKMIFDNGSGTFRPSKSDLLVLKKELPYFDIEVVDFKA
jgi:hypothetical protein